MKAKFWMVRSDGSETERFDSVCALYNNVMQGTIIAKVTGCSADDECLLLARGKLCCPPQNLRDIVDHLSSLCPLCYKGDDAILDETISMFLEYGDTCEPDTGAK